MKKLNIKITSDRTQKSFDIFLRLTGWWNFEGKWECLPGYLFENSGFFWLNTGYNSLNFENREMTSGEMVSVAWGGSSFESQGITSYMHLEKFDGTVSVGSQGNGCVFHYGKTGRETMTDNGFYGSEVTWKVTLVQ
jgi:hypothetical protein